MYCASQRGESKISRRDTNVCPTRLAYLVTLIDLLGTGGTIASRSTGDHGAVASDPVGALAADVPSDVTVRSRDVLTTGSYRLGLADLRRICEAVAASVTDPEVTGVVVTHGTDTIEETAFLLDLVHDAAAPVVLTGAQRPADRPDTDGPRNVRDAVAVAASTAMRGCGAMVAFDGTVRSARGVRKTHTVASDPFDGGTVLAHVQDGEVDALARTRRGPALAPPKPTFDDLRVDIVSTYPGATPALLRQAADLGADAIVLAGTGVGNAGPGFAEAIAELSNGGCPVILASRVPWGPVVPIYGNGGGVDLVAAGAVVAGDLNPYQARILASLVLSTDPGPAAVRDAFRPTEDPTLKEHP